MSKYVTHKEVTSSQSALLLQNLFYDYIKENKLLFIGLLITTFLTFPVESIVLPRLYSKLFDKVRKIVRLPAITIKNPLKSLKEWTPVGMIYTIFFIWIFLLLGYGIKQTLQAKMYPEYLSFLRQKILGETIKSHQENYQDVKIGKHISRLLDFTRESRNCVNYIMGNFLPVIIGSICIILYFLKVDLTLGLAVGLGFGLIFLVLYFVGRTCVDLSCDREGLYLEMSEHIHDSLGNLMNVYLNNQEKKEIAKNSRIEKKHTKFYKAQILLTRNVVFTLSLISLVTFISVLVLSYNKLRQKVISTELFSTLVIILMYFFGYLMNLSDEIPGFLVRLGILKQSVPFLYDILNQQQQGTRNNVIKNGKVE